MLVAISTGSILAFDFSLAPAEDADFPRRQRAFQLCPASAADMVWLNSSTIHMSHRAYDNISLHRAINLLASSDHFNIAITLGLSHVVRSQLPTTAKLLRSFAVRVWRRRQTLRLPTPFHASQHLPFQSFEITSIFYHIRQVLTPTCHKSTIPWNFFQQSHPNLVSWTCLRNCENTYSPSQ